KTPKPHYVCLKIDNFKMVTVPVAVNSHSRMQDNCIEKKFNKGNLMSNALDYNLIFNKQDNPDFHNGGEATKKRGDLIQHLYCYDGHTKAQGYPCRPNSINEIYSIPGIQVSLYFGPQLVQELPNEARGLN
ncbi:MAG: hypothetical protein ACKO96_13000, partial [Flammeovirgaceae bacterium]